MRFKSKEVAGYQVFAVAGVNTVSFGIRATEVARRNLLGFAVQRFDQNENERYFMQGFKVFRSLIPNPSPDTRVSTWDHPIQSFVWDDFTAKPDCQYEYLFFPIKGKPKSLDRSASPIKIRVHTEPLFSSLEHDIFFNRGVASSQAYKHEFGNLKPDKLPAEKKAKALEWLSRKLDEAIIEFILKAKKGDALRCCFYEFRYGPVLDALKKSIDRGVEVQIIIDAKVNEYTDKKGIKHLSFPRTDNLKAITKAGISKKYVILREAKPNEIQHNKFMVLLKGKHKRPVEVWTGSTNLSIGGFHGQTNVGHWVRNSMIAERFYAYWTLLSGDPGAQTGQDKKTSMKENAAFKSQVESLANIPRVIADIPKGVTPVFSPRKGLNVLDLYVSLLDSASTCSCITLAFGVNAAFKEQLKDNLPHSHLVLMLLEKADKPNKKSKKPFIVVNASNNVYKAWGSFIKDPVYQWAKETNARFLEFNTHVAYIHSKFLLMDPLGDDPIVVTGSANFSKPSVNDNDENMLIIRGDHRVADIYFTEFNRLFNHYYFRAVHEMMSSAAKDNAEYNPFLEEDDSWLMKYKPGKLRQKRLELFIKMKGT